MKKQTISSYILIAISLLGSAFVLASCAKPMTSAPKLEAADVAAERAAQQQMISQAHGASAATADVALLSMEEMTARMNRVSPRIQKSGTEICQQMWGNKQNCSFSFAIANQDVLNAWADGKGVFITPKMISFARTDEELANVLAHEYAHNVLNHPQSTGQNAAVGSIGGLLLDTLASSQGLNTGGQFSKIGADFGQYHYSVAFEKEADYVGLYILANAGYDVNGAVNFWARFTTQNSAGLERSRSHPSNPERSVAMRSTIAEIKQKQSTNQPLFPNLKKK